MISDALCWGSVAQPRLRPPQQLSGHLGHCHWAWLAQGRSLQLPCARRRGVRHGRWLRATGARLWPPPVGSEGTPSTARLAPCSECAWIPLGRSGSRVVSARPTLPKHAFLWAPMRPCCSLWVPPRAPQPATWRSGASSQAGRVAPASWMGLGGVGAKPRPRTPSPPPRGGMVRG